MPIQKKRKRGRPRKIKPTEPNVSNCETLDHASHKSRPKKTYIMKRSAMQERLVLTPPSKFLEEKIDNSDSTEIHNKKDFKFGPCLSSFSKRNMVSSRFSASKSSLFSITNTQDDDGCLINVSQTNLSQFENKTKKLIFECDKTDQHQMEISYVSKRAFLINLKSEKNSPELGNVFLDPPLLSKSDIAVEFFQFNSDFKQSKWKELMFAGRLKKKNNFKIAIDYNLLELTLKAFFQMKNIGPYIANLNDYEYIYVSIFLFKKNFVNWSNYDIDFYKLQSSRSKKRKEHFLKFLLKKFFKYLSDQKLYFFGDKNCQIKNRMKSIFFESNKRRKDDPISNRMENLGKILCQNEKFKEFYDSCDIDKIIKTIFEHYCEKQMKKLVKNHVMRFEEEMKLNLGDPFLAFSNVIFNLMKKKLKIMWTYMEFKQAQEVLDLILNN
jgi:hypothetical protein